MVQCGGRDNHELARFLDLEVTNTLEIKASTLGSLFIFTRFGSAQISVSHMTSLVFIN